MFSFRLLLTNLLFVDVLSLAHAMQRASSTVLVTDISGYALSYPNTYKNDTGLYLDLTSFRIAQLDGRNLSTYNTFSVVHRSTAVRLWVVRGIYNDGKQSVLQSIDALGVLEY